VDEPTRNGRLVELVAAYGRRIAPAVAGAGHQVVSPLGIWLLVATASREAAPRDRDRLEVALGCPLEEAVALTSAFLADPPAGLAAGHALWHNPDLVVEEFPGWTSGLPPAIEQGPIPSQADADAWAARHTLDMIDRFPLGLKADAAIVLATALAVRFTWIQAYETADPSRLGDSPWARTVDQVLEADEAELIDDPAAGLVGLHRRTSEGSNMVVHSAIADPGVRREDVLEVARARCVGRGRPLGEVELARLGERAPRPEQAWSIGRASSRGVATSVLPAWEIDESITPLKLDAEVFGTPAAGDRLRRFLREPGPVTAAQSALARYGRRGFEAAAVTGMMVRATGMMQPEHPSLHVRFGRPFAAVAAVGTGRWAGLPLFEAWVDRPARVADLEAAGGPAGR
jgi:hypothetical protein